MNTTSSSPVQRSKKSSSDPETAKAHSRETSRSKPQDQKDRTRAFTSRSLIFFFCTSILLLFLYYHSSTYSQLKMKFNPFSKDHKEGQQAHFEAPGAEGEEKVNVAVSVLS